MADKTWREIGFGGGEAKDLKKSPVGTSWEGQYVGKREITTDFGVQYIYSFLGEGGEFGVFGFTDLNQKLAQVETGTEVRMTYEGMFNVKTKRGNTQMHRVRLEVA